MVYTLQGKGLDIGTVTAVVRGGAKIGASKQALARAARSKTSLDAASRAQLIYGVNTGFGPMADRLIGPEELDELQRNLVRSHACGAGEPVPDEQVLAAMVVRFNTLLRGDSGVSAKLLQLLAALINARCAPIVPEHGGVGASGDLIQLSHIALAIIGEGEVSLRGTRMSAAAAFKKMRLTPHRLEPKEGLALINGTSFMTGVAALAVADAEQILSSIVRQSALALEVVGAFDDSLAPYLHAARPHAGQGAVATMLRELTRGGSLRSRRLFERSEPVATGRLERAVQDVYSLRCAPQILGPIYETLAAVRTTVEIEMNSATDNPLISPDGEMLHGGNFHGEYIASAMDRLKAAFAKASMLCERRLNFLLHDKINGLFPPFLNLGTPGLTLGLQALQFVATSTTAQNQSYAYPHALHSIPSNADNQDIVSMGADAARSAAQVLRNTALVAAIELIALSHAAALRPPKSKAGTLLVARVRRIVPLMKVDRPLTSAIQKLTAAVCRGELLPLVPLLTK